MYRVNKYGNEPSKCELDHGHASKLESSVCQILQLRMKAGEILNIQSQDHVYLTLARIHYIPDFRCTGTDGIDFWVEAKGYASDRWPTIKKLWAYYGLGRLEIFTGHWKNPVLTETITPKGK